ncbi:glycoside hydrolase superfamily [Pseudoneurospora amorphoporcata]|uniref:xylan 1,4-beta-xylosidase n=1 Tax=Pseudoneurospora amorphoporcata TaxID=241081 RepID=A0AAN6SHZ4_9PEZI|nr:glycoside hydrolase superfamily [Pseudoneurospora amorphoporcata]
MKPLPPSAIPLLACVLRANAFQFPDCINGVLAKTKACDSTASAPDRAASLVEQLTIDEKLVNLVDQSKGAHRLGLPPYAWWSEGLHGVAGSPGVVFNTSGYPFSYATSFANAITLGAAFDDDLVYEVATAISTEARAFANFGFGGLDYWTPNINPYKDPRWGRGAETPGEDPLRIKGYVKAMVAGLEGNGTVRKVIATCKHFAAYDLERWRGLTRYEFDAVVSLQDLSEYYLPPFQQCARDSKVGSIMCRYVSFLVETCQLEWKTTNSYNALNGTPACASTYLMTDILRDHWNWTDHNNYITSDCNAIQDFLPDNHNFSQTPAEAAAAAYVAGTDTVCEVSGWPPYTDVVGAYNQSLLSEAVIDTALRRLYEGLIRAGYLDHGRGIPSQFSSPAYDALDWKDVNTPSAQGLALRSATEGIVLLKNSDSLLPLDLTGKTVALIGHWANATRTIRGPYSGLPPFYHNPLYAAQQLKLSFYYANGPVVNATDLDTWTAAAMKAAEGADVVLYFGGTDTTVASEDLDRESIAWPETQLALIEKLAQVGKPMVVIQLGDQVDDSWLLSHSNISSILWVGYPGQSGGTAVFDILTGKKAPAGRLPVTQYPAGYVDEVPLTEMGLRPFNHSSSSSSEVEDDQSSVEGGLTIQTRSIPGNKTLSSPGRTYKWYSRAVLPFGYGLHYTTFNVSLSLSPLSNSTSFSFTIPSLITPCKATHLDLCPFSPFSVSITNTGTTTSDYVALLFLSGEFGPKPYPLKTLVSYKRVKDIKPGETRVVSGEDIPVNLGAIARVDGNGHTVLYPGTYKFRVDLEGDGLLAGKRDVVVELVGEEKVLDEFPQPRE